MKREEKKKMIQENIINGLFELMKYRSWDSISSDEISKSVGISKKTLYSYYGSQDEMYLQLVMKSFETLSDFMEKNLLHSNSLEDKIIDLGKAYLKFMKENVVMGKLIIEFDENKFKENYLEKVKIISDIANKYEILSFSKQEKNPIERKNAIMLWSHIQGLSQLIVNKEKWLEEYYGESIEKIIEEQMEVMKLNLC